MFAGHFARHRIIQENVSAFCAGPLGPCAKQAGADFARFLTIAHDSGAKPHETKTKRREWPAKAHVFAKNSHEIPQVNELFVQFLSTQYQHKNRVNSYLGRAFSFLKRALSWPFRAVSPLLRVLSSRNRALSSSFPPNPVFGENHEVPHRHTDMPVSQDVYHSLLTAAGQTGFQKECWEIVEAAIRDWMVRHHPDSFPNPKVAGYQWKNVFLPNGTLLRTVFGGRNYHCTVEEDDIHFRGSSVSPSGFVNAVGGVRRSAWKVVWILLPDTSSWQLAATMRARPKMERRPEPNAPAGQTPNAY